MRTIPLQVLLAAAALLALPGCRRDGPDWRVVGLCGGKTGFDILRKPDNVRAFRLRPERVTPKPGELHAGPYLAAGDAVDAPPDAAAELSSILTDAATYDWRRAKSGPFAPQLGLRFVRGSQTVELSLDFDSAQLGIYGAGMMFGAEDFDASHARLASVARRLFPDDPSFRDRK
jgi:hypothetical protein